MHAARITVSAIGIGPDRSLLTLIASLGHGGFVMIDDARLLLILAQPARPAIP